MIIVVKNVSRLSVIKSYDRAVNDRSSVWRNFKITVIGLRMSLKI